jgi:Ca-activated chloride channel family protein
VLLLVLPPAVALFLWWSGRKRRELMSQFIQARLLPGLIAGVSPRRQKVRFACLILAVAALLLALAGPRWGFSWQEVKQRGVDIVVAIDTSKSMLAEDIPPNRLARAKLAALDLMQLAKNDRLGLVAFAGTAFLQCPLTIDDSAFRQSVDALDVNTLPEGGTALAEAIETAMTAYKEGDNHRILVLLTDGEDHDSGVVEAAKKASQAGLRIYTIGIGTPQGELLHIKDAQGKSDYIRDEEGHVVKSHLNQDLLVELASATGGFYLPLQGPKTMNTLFEHPQGIAQLPKSEHQEKFVKQLHERYHWPLGAAILLLILEMLVPERARQRKTRAASAPAGVSAGIASRPVAAAVTSILLFLLAAAPLQASTSSALREYKAGKYEDALKEYERLLQKKADDPRLHFNAGTAAYQNHQYDEAAKQFDQALGSPDLKLQELGYYNRGNSLFRLGEQIPDPAKRTEAWEKSLKDFELTTRLNPQDADAKFNHEFVKRKLEELKQQQQQQDKSDQKKSDQQKPEDDQNQSQQRQDKQNQQQEQQGQQKQDQNQHAQQQQDKSQNQQQKQSSQPPDQQQPPNTKKQNQQPQPDQQKPKQAAAQPKKDAGEKGDKEGTAYAAAQMTPEQAERLLDAQKGEEMMLPPQPPAKPRDRTRPIKDW